MINKLRTAGYSMHQSLTGETAQEAGKIAGMYGGGGFLGAAAGGMMNLMAGDQEDFLGSVMKGGAMGLAGGAAVRSLTTRGGYLNDFGLAIGRTMDSGAAVKKAERLEKLNTKLTAAADDPEKMAKISEQITKLEGQEGGGMTRFFNSLSEGAEKRESRLLDEYSTLAGKDNPTESEVSRMAKLESDYGIQGNTKMADEQVIYARGTESDDFRAMNNDEFNAYINKRKESGDAYDLDIPGNKDQYFEFKANESYQNFENTASVYPETLTTQRRQIPAAGYNMHKDIAQNSISSRNRGLIVGGAGLTGAMVGYSHSSGRKNKRRGFNSTRGSRF